MFHIEAGWDITVLVAKFAELRDVLFRVYSCGNCCHKVEQRLKEEQQRTIKELDEEYERSMKQALIDEGMEFVQSTRHHTNRRRGKKCSIM